MPIYCPSGNIPRLILYSLWQLAAMWNYIDLNLKDEIQEIQAEILFFQGTVRG